jgi:glucose-6-phosphate isomerase
MSKIKIDISRALPFIKAEQFHALELETEKKRNLLIAGTGKGNDFLGWLRLPSEVQDDLILQINKDAERIAANSKLLVVIGIGGSYLGTRAVIESLDHSFRSLLSGEKAPCVIYAGHHLGEDYHAALLEVLDLFDYSVAVISKSGTTTEPAVAFRIIRAHLEKKYGKKEAAGRIIAITDASRGALKNMAAREGYSTYVIPDDVGGRYSVLTPVGLLPIAAAGFDIRRIITGAKEMQEICFASPDNPANTYAAIRNALYNTGKKVEILVNYQPGLQYLAEWWKQLYGESEGKENKGIFPAAVGFTTDLHSMGQYIQDGLRILFETIISVENPDKVLTVPREDTDLDGLNFLAGRRISEINHMASLGTMLAHCDGGVPNIRLSVPCINEEVIGQLIYFFEFACALSGYVLDVNPFDQPGVEAYKKNMFALLGKPGFEAEGEALRKKLI